MNYKQYRNVVEIFVSPDFGRQKLDKKIMIWRGRCNCSYKYMSDPIKGVFMKELRILLIWYEYDFFYNK